MMEQSIFKVLVGQYQTPHPMLGVDGQAFPMIPYSMKLDLIQNAEAFQGLTMDDFINAETRRVKQLLDAANERGDAQLATRVLNELYPLMVEDVQSGNPVAVQVYSPVVNQMKYIIGATQQPQAQPVAQEQIYESEPMPSFAEGDRLVDAASVEAEFVEADPEPVSSVAVDPEPVATMVEEVEPVHVEPVQELQQAGQEEPVDQGNDHLAQEGEPAQAEQNQAVPNQIEQNQAVSNQTASNQDLSGAAEPNSAPVVTRKKKRTPASSIVLFILGGTFLLAFLFINALPFMGVGSYEELFLMGLFDIAIGCLVLALVCCVVAGIILWRSKAKN